MEQAYLRPDKKRQPSFTALVRERFTEELTFGIRAYVQREKRLLIRSSLTKVIVTDVSEDRLYFHALFDCLLSGDGTVSFRGLIADASCAVEGGFHSVLVRDVLPMYDGYRPHAVLPDSLVPSISKEELDRLAEKLIARLYPRSRDCAVPVSPDAAARRLGLQVIERDLGTESGLLGKIFFEDAVTALPAKDGHVIVPVSRGTMLVNTSPDGFYDSRVRAATILHECAHWILHRPAYALRKELDRTYVSSVCRTRSAASGEWTDLRRMEWQADAVASRLLLPEWSARRVAETWLARYSRLPRILKMERVIDRMSRHFGVSRRMAKIRMTELGYPDAESAFAFYEKRKYRIPFENAVRLFGRDPAFTSALASGAYAYIENCFVVLSDRNVYREESGALRLTPYAKAHMDGCCLSFASRRVRKGSACGMLRLSVEEEFFLSGSELGPQELARCTRSVAAILQNLPPSFSETLAAHMKRKRITNEQLAERCLLSDRQIYRFKSTLFPSISLRSAVCLCVGLKLHPLLAEDLIQKAGYRFNSSEEHAAYHMLILSMTGRSIYECNEYLRSAGAKPLGTEEM